MHFKYENSVKLVSPINVAFQMKMEQRVHPLRNLLQKWRWEKYFSRIIFIAICGISNVECKLNSENLDHYYDLNI